MSKPSFPRSSAKQRKKRFNPHRLHRFLLNTKITIVDIGGTVAFVWLVIRTLIRELH